MFKKSLGFVRNFLLSINDKSDLRDVFPPDDSQRKSSSTSSMPRDFSGFKRCEIFKSYIAPINVCHGKRFSSSCDTFLFWLYLKHTHSCPLNRRLSRRKRVFVMAPAKRVRYFSVITHLYLESSLKTRGARVMNHVKINVFWNRTMVRSVSSLV